MRNWSRSFLSAGCCRRRVLLFTRLPPSSSSPAAAAVYTALAFRPVAATWKKHGTAAISPTVRLPRCPSVEAINSLGLPRHVDCVRRPRERLSRDCECVGLSALTTVPSYDALRYDTRTPSLISIIVSSPGAVGQGADQRLGELFAALQYNMTQWEQYFASDKWHVEPACGRSGKYRGPIYLL